MPCRQHLSQLRQQYPQIQAEGGDVVAIFFEARDRLFQLTRQLRLPFPILSDPERDVYAAYGLAQGSWTRIFSLKTVWTYVKHFDTGHGYHYGSGDWKQLGGDFVVGEVGAVLYEHRSQTPNDRPTVASLIAELGG